MMTGGQVDPRRAELRELLDQLIDGVVQEAAVTFVRRGEGMKSKGELEEAGEGCAGPEEFDIGTSSSDSSEAAWVGHLALVH